MRYFCLAIAVAGLVSSVPAASASTVFYLTTDGCSSSCGSSPFGTISLTQTDPNTVTAAFSLSPGEHFVNTGAGSALDFNIAGAAPVITILPSSTPDASGYTVGGADHASAFGYFEYSILCSGCGNGGSSAAVSGPIDFTIYRSTGLTIGDFITSAAKKNGPVGATDYYFASDIMGTTGSTGNVAALEATATPEPTYKALMLGLLCAAAWLGRRKLVRAA